MSNENMENEDGLFLTLTLEDGKELECEVIAKFPVTVNGVEKSYIALYPSEVIDGYEDGDVFLYQCEDLAEDEIHLNPIEDEEEYELVADAFDELLDEEAFNDMSEE